MHSSLSGKFKPTVLSHIHAAGNNCAGCGPSTAGRATAVSMARQRSERLTPLYLWKLASECCDGGGGRAIRSGKASNSLLLDARNTSGMGITLMDPSSVPQG